MRDFLLQINPFWELMRWGLEKGLESKGWDEARRGQWREGGRPARKEEGRADQGWPSSESPGALALIDFFFTDILFYYQVSD